MWVFLLAVRFISLCTGPVFGQWMEIYTTADVPAVELVEWTLAFRAVSGSLTMVYELYRQNTPFGHAHDTTDHYMGEIIPSWSQHNITKVKVLIISQNKEKAFFLFDATSSDASSWFSQDRLINTSYSDLTSTTRTNIFSIEGDNARRFFINERYSGCPGDIGWLVVIDANTSRFCGWQHHPDTYPYPYLSVLVLHAQTSTAANWNDYDYIAETLLPPEEDCECYCYVHNKTKPTTDELEDMIYDIRKELIIDKKTLKKNILKKISVKDNRPSSIAIGVFGALLFSVPFVCVIVIDCLSLKQFLDRKKKTLKKKRV